MTPPRSDLVTSQDCAACGRCCDELAIWVADEGGLFERIQMLRTDVVSASRTPLRDASGTPWLILHIAVPCEHHRVEETGSSCDLMGDPDRPALCGAYPTNQFVDVEHRTPLWRDGMVGQVRDVAATICPPLGERSIEEIEVEITRATDGDHP